MLSKSVSAYVFMMAYRQRQPSPGDLNIFKLLNGDNFLLLSGFNLLLLSSV